MKNSSEKKKFLFTFSIKHAFLLLFVVNMLGLLALKFLYTAPPAPIALEQTQIPAHDSFRGHDEAPQETKISFENPVLAYKILQQLDVWKPVNDKYFELREGNFIHNYSEPYMGLKNDEEFCDKHRAFFVNNPQRIFDEKNVIVSSNHMSHFRGVFIPLVANDIQPYINSSMPKKLQNQFFYDIDPAVNLFFSVKPFNENKHIGKHFSCLTQLSNHIPGHNAVTRKDFASENSVNYAKYYQDRPQCFNNDKFFPKTYILYNKEDCQEFFKTLDSPETQQLKKERGIVFIRKIGAGSHKGDGVFPMDAKEEANIRAIYDNGAKCGSENKNFIVQNYIHNPLLINGRKFDFRMFILIASTNPFIAYYYDGSLRVSLMEYEVESGDKKTLLTNIALNKQIYAEVKKGNLYNGMDVDDVKHAQQWDFPRLLEYLLDEGIVEDPNWLDNYLRPEFKKAMIHLLRSSQDKYLENSSIYGLWGVDFMIDTDLNLWFIEANSAPSFTGGYSDEAEKFYIKMLKDHFEIVYGLLKSRISRIVKFVNKMTVSGDAVEAGNEVIVRDLEGKRREFEAITRNYFEKEYEPSHDNGFAKIIDENFEGVARYQGLLEQECL